MRSLPSPAAGLGALVSAAGMAVLAVHGFSVPGAPLGLPVAGLGLLTLGAGLAAPLSSIRHPSERRAS